MNIGAPTVLNLIPGGIIPIVYANQYDKGYEKRFLLYKGAEPFNIADNMSVTVRGTKGDNHGIINSVSSTVGSNLVSVTLTEQMTAVEGVRNVYELRIVDTNGLLVGTVNFILAVEPSALNDETIISDSDLSYAEDVYNRLQGVEAYYNKFENEKITRFATCVDMKASTALKSGMICQTAGYYSVNDGGAALYYVMGAAPVDDYYETLQGGLIGVLVANDTVTPEMFGAYGDGDHDDTTAVQSAINTKQPVVFSKLYKITEMLTIFNNSVLIGKSQNNTFSDSMTTGLLTTTNAFNSETGDSVSSVTIRNLNIRCTSEDCALFVCGVRRSAITVWCHNLALLNIDISRVGMLYVTVKDSYFISTKKFIIYTGTGNVGISDSLFLNNYFSGKLTQDSIFSTVFYGNVRFISNYFDFWYRIFYFPNSQNVSLIFQSNIIDYTVMVFSGKYDRVLVIGNTFNSIKPTSGRWDNLPNTEIFAVFRNGLRNYSASIGNSIDAQYYIYCKGNYPNKSSVSYGNQIKDGEIVWEPYPNDSTDLLYTRVEELNYKTYDALVNPSLTFGSNERFNHQFVEVNGIIYINRNGEWKSVTISDTMNIEREAETVPANSTLAIKLYGPQYRARYDYMVKPSTNIGDKLTFCAYSSSDSQLYIIIANPTSQNIALPAMTWKLRYFDQ